MGYSHPREEEDECRDNGSKEDLPPLKIRRLESSEKEVIDVSDSDTETGNCEIKRSYFDCSDLKSENSAQLTNDLNENNGDLNGGNFKISEIRNETKDLNTKNSVHNDFKNGTDIDKVKHESVIGNGIDVKSECCPSNGINEVKSENVAGNELDEIKKEIDEFKREKDKGYKSEGKKLEVKREKEIKIKKKQRSTKAKGRIKNKRRFLDSDSSSSSSSSSESEDERESATSFLSYQKFKAKVFDSSRDILGEIPQVEDDPKIWEPMTFHPTYEEFKDLKKYVTYMESCGAHKCGIAKIVPPKEWVPRKQGYNPSDIDVELDHPVQQNISVTEVDGAFKTISDRSIPHFTVEKYMRLATNDKYITPPHNSYEELEELYWKQNVDDKLPAPIYGADVCDSITDPEVTVWNIKRLDSLLTDVMEEQIPGVNLPYLYFGMWKATFSWHVEDRDLYGVNLLHYGAPKTWYCIPPQKAYMLEQVAQKLFPDMTRACFNLLRHKAIMIGPKLLEANGVRVNKMTQEERNMIIVFPHAYHSGFNHGYNIAESTNFALPRWVEYGKRFRDCVCRDNEDEVSFNLDPFVKKCQPEKYHAWRRGEDWALHPEDPWYIKRCYTDAEMRYARDEISQREFLSLKKELKRKREIPRWFKDRFNLDYCDDIKFLEVDLTDCIEVLGSSGNVVSPRVWSAKKKLMKKVKKGKNNVDVRMRKLRKTTAEIYLSEMQAYYEMRAEMERDEERRKELAAKGSGDYSLGDGAARGVGFAGADVQDLLEKKARTICKAKKKHRFKACAKCTGCRRENCGECMYCLDMPKYGGMGVIKQKCETRVCVNPTITTCEHCVWTI